MAASIPFVDLKAQYQSIKAEIDDAISQCIDECNFIKGHPVDQFEKEFAQYLGLKRCITCGNGTDALELILTALGIGKGDEVIVPAISWIATAECVNNVGAEPVFVDVDINCLIDLNKIGDKITERTKAIIPVHLYGNPVNMDELSSIASKQNLYIVEDCAQSHGAEFKGRKTGTFGIASAFSFFPSKNLGAFGDAGAVLSNNDELADKVRMLSNHGQLITKHSHEITGRNSRMDTIQAAVLRVKLKYLDEWNEKRINSANLYSSLLKNVAGIKTPVLDGNKKHVFHLFIINCENRQLVIDRLNNNHIPFGIHYPNPLPFLEAYSYKNHLPQDFNLAAELSGKIISLPIYPEITPEQIEHICNIIR